MNSKKTMKAAFEAMMYIWGGPLDVKQAAEVFDLSRDDAYKLFKELEREYQEEGRGIVIREINGSFQYVTRPEMADYVEKLCTPVKVKKLSQSALEVLAIIAYKQPVTKGEIEAIRGIKCERIIDGLSKKQLIEEKGRSNAVGRPILYGTTDEFLKKFGFSNISELPDIDDIEGIIGDNDDVEVEKFKEEDDIFANQIKLDLGDEINGYEE